MYILFHVQNPYIIMMIAIIMCWNHQPGIVHIYIDKLYNIMRIYTIVIYIYVC